MQTELAELQERVNQLEQLVGTFKDTPYVPIPFALQYPVIGSLTDVGSKIIMKEKIFN